MYICKNCGEKYHGNYGACGKCGGSVVIDTSQPPLLPDPKGKRSALSGLSGKGLAAAIVAAILFMIAITMSMPSPEQTPAQKVELASAMVAAQKRLALERLNSKKDFDKWLLRQGYDVYIKIEGNNSERMSVSCPIFTRVTVQRLDDQGQLRKELGKRGFTSIWFYGYREEIITLWDI